MTNVSQDIVILSGKVLNKDPLEGSVKEEFAKRIVWKNSDFELDGAKLIVTADQPATSGADLQVFVNGDRVRTIRWEAFDTDEKSVESDVLRNMLNGINDFDFLYNAPNHHLQAAAVPVDAKLKLEFRRVTGSDSNDDTPASGGSTTDERTFDKFANGIKEHAKLILSLAVVTGVGITVFKFWDKLSLRGIFSKANFINRR